MGIAYLSNRGFVLNGGSSTLITKNILENGTYNASDDNADGYSSVTVNVLTAEVYAGASVPENNFGNDGDICTICSTAYKSADGHIYTLHLKYFPSLVQNTYKGQTRYTLVSAYLRDEWGRDILGHENYWTSYREVQLVTEPVITSDGMLTFVYSGSSGALTVSWDYSDYLLNAEPILDCGTVCQKVNGVWTEIKPIEI